MHATVIDHFLSMAVCMAKEGDAEEPKWSWNSESPCTATHARGQSRRPSARSKVCSSLSEFISNDTAYISISRVCDSRLIFEGVQKLMTDMNRHLVEVTGMIDPQKVLKKLRKKMGKRVELLGIKKDGDDPKDEASTDTDGSHQEQSPVIAVEQNAVMDTKFVYCSAEEDMLMMFSDENPNACCTM
ncbi:hypothetical protein SAY87_023717 [Trapa incisa]|uniref:Uncharacterized protein n=1 Tax=Trapa incisa TaxID=236973 RepID=A0AAN7QSE3_9MYRT|nr:hypothetical protein SAY87_023717 [Trapa incisa]